MAGTLGLVVTVGMACGDDPAGPVLDTALVTGTWSLTTLAFDPQGSLAELDALDALGTQPQLILSPTGTVQIVYQDPTTNLFTTIAGSFRTTSNGARVTFDDNAPYATLLLSRRMDFVLDTTAARRLVFDGTAPDGVNRARLIQLEPDLADEQLLNPVPGTLEVVFTR
jgi:hypothetical protein